MILSNLSIQHALDKGWLLIDPEPAPRRPTQDRECPFNTSSVDLTLGDEIVQWKKVPVSIDLREGGISNLSRTATKVFRLSEEQPFALQSGQFVLGRTHERIALTIPANRKSPCLAARIEGRSSFARCGLLIHFTAPTVHAGFAGPLVMEMCNLGPYPILLYAGMRICQLIVEQVDGVPFRNDSQFQHQSGPRG